MNSFELSIKPPKSEIITLTANPSNTIGSIKSKLKLPLKEFNLMHKGNSLEERETLSHYKIDANSLLEVVRIGTKKLDIITLGAGKVGKTSILKKFETGEFKLERNTTIGVDFVIKKVLIDNEEVKLKLWDTAGQECYFAVSGTTYKKCQGALVVFDVQKEKSFRMVEKWINALKQQADASIIIYLIGNKIDVPEREVTTEEAKALAKTFDLPYYETSAKTGANVNEVLLSLANEIYAKRYGNTSVEPIVGSASSGSVTLKSSKTKEKSERNCCR
eukprot:TRINITY_DN4408_c0_g1_i2.p1 TRINITY_DN4408_c0_g1~~TRINITY_DN4408_c0_g1_i2.p1  ORF type:complete len:275 (+),score=85.13 TRINITY_DN4408_c0_g1_i2:160-984(+)